LTVPSRALAVANRLPVASNVMLVIGVAAARKCAVWLLVGFHSSTAPPDVPIASVLLGANASDTV
jgi:hypothetical protein